MKSSSPNGDVRPETGPNEAITEPGSPYTDGNGGGGLAERGRRDQEPLRATSLAPLFGTTAVPDEDDQRAHISVSVIVPTLNEARNLPHVLPRIPEWVHEVLLVDGGSSDDTVEVARSLLPGIVVLGQDRPGKGAALQAGFRAATGDIIVTLDGDGSTDPAELPAFVGCLLAGADFVKGSRFAQGGGTADMTTVRRLGNWTLRSVVRAAFGGRYSDLCYGYNAFWRRILPLLDGEADGFEIETLLNVRALAAGMRVVEVPSYERKRVHGLSNLHTLQDGYRVLRTITRERLYVRSCRRGAPWSPSPNRSAIIHGTPRFEHSELDALIRPGNGHAPMPESLDGGH